MHHDDATLNERRTYTRNVRKLPQDCCGKNRPVKRLRLRQASGIRHELVARVRAEIAAGTYLTEARINSAIARLYNELDPRDGHRAADVRPASRTG